MEKARLKRLGSSVPVTVELGFDSVAVDVLTEELAVGVSDGLVPIEVDGLHALPPAWS